MDEMPVKFSFPNMILY